MNEIPPSPLRGESPPGIFTATTGDGQPVNPIEAIFPILCQFSSGQWRLIGTGFFITTNGLFVTAKHVLLDVLGRNGKQTHPIALCQFLPNNQYLLRPIRRCTTHEIADIGIGVAAQMTNNDDGSMLSNKILTLTVKPPMLYQPVWTYAYPKTIIHFEPLRHEIHFYPTYFDGELHEYFPNGRDRVLLPAPCYRSNMLIHGGASGGPVFSLNGCVFGINSTGINGSEDLSFISRINEILPLAVTDVLLPGCQDGKPVKILELAERGFVVFKPPLRHLMCRSIPQTSEQHK